MLLTVVTHRLYALRVRPDPLLELLREIAAPPGAAAGVAAFAPLGHVALAAIVEIYRRSKEYAAPE